MFHSLFLNNIFFKQQGTSTFKVWDPYHSKRLMLFSIWCEYTYPRAESSPYLHSKPSSIHLGLPRDESLRLAVPNRQNNISQRWCHIRLLLLGHRVQREH